MCRFFDVDGSPMSMEDFIDSYSKSYFLGNSRKVKGTTQNSKFAENEIEHILQTGIQSELDVVHILAWKIGKIKHTDCDSEKKFCYHKDWLNAEQYIIKRYNRPFEIKGLAHYIASNIAELEVLAQNQPQKVLNLLKEKSPQGIGSVYIVTLLFFISKGKIPIYDRFAAVALDAICNGNAPNSMIQYKELPSKNSEGFLMLYEKELSQYISKLKSVFNDKYLKCRDIDRALWVYGHLFQQVK